MRARGLLPLAFLSLKKPRGKKGSVRTFPKRGIVLTPEENTATKKVHYVLSCMQSNQWSACAPKSSVLYFCDMTEPADSKFDARQEFEDTMDEPRRMGMD